MPSEGGPALKERPPAGAPPGPRVEPFRIDACAVTNARYAEFVADTGPAVLTVASGPRRTR